jgi:hypothetical protein
MSESILSTDAGARPPFPWGQKFAATGLHLLLSVVAVGALLLLVTRLWYPEFLFRTDGGWQGLRIVILVDLVLGPLLTFVVYRRGKKGLLTDLVLIGLMQAAALLGGAWVVHAERPLALVLHEGRVYSITADDYRDAGVPVPSLHGLAARPPDYLVAVPPESPVEQSPVRTAYLGRGQFIYTHVPWLRDRRTHGDAVAAAGLDPAEILDRSEQTRLQDWLEANGKRAEEIMLLPYSSRFRLVYLITDRRTGRLLDALDVSSG